MAQLIASDQLLNAVKYLFQSCQCHRPPTNLLLNLLLNLIERNLYEKGIVAGEKDFKFNPTSCACSCNSCQSGIHVILN